MLRKYNRLTEMPFYCLSKMRSIALQGFDLITAAKATVENTIKLDLNSTLSTTACNIHTSKQVNLLLISLPNWLNNLGI